MTVPTVRIAAPDAPGGFVVINEADLTDQHTLFGEEKAPAKRGRKPKGSQDGDVDEQATQGPAGE